LASPEAARMVLVTRAHLFKPTYPPSKERMIGPQALFFHQGDYHLRMRRAVQGWLGPDALRALVPDVEAAVASTLRWWEGRRETSTFHTMKRVCVSCRRPAVPAGLRSSSIVRVVYDVCLADFSVVDLPYWLLFQFTFDVGVVTIFGRRLAEHVKEELRRNYFIVENGYNSFPVPGVPWTRYSQAIKVHEGDD
jgi:(+)-abscisic acid 8'-hydroxylase